MPRQIIAAILALFLAAILGLMIYDLVTGGPPDVAAIIRAILLSVIGAFFLGRLTSGKGRDNHAGYEALYGNLLRSAFRDRPQKRAALLEAIHQFQTRSYARAEVRLAALLPDCKSKDDFAAVKLFLGAACAKQEKYREAEDWYRSLLEREPNHSMAWTNLGNVYSRQEKLAEARDAFQRAVDCDQGNPYPYGSLAELYLRQNQPEQAMEWAKRSLEQDDTHLYAMKLAAAAAKALGDSDQQAHYSQMFLDAGGDSRELRNTLKRGW